LHDASQLVCPETKLFLRDCHDHCVQIIELVETYRELGASLMEVHLSSLSNRMNEVMKMLTVITTIFVPLTFIAGVYGMNFNPGSSPWNMPELNSYWGYPLCLTLMLTLAIGELWFFWRKGWLFQSKTSTSPVSQSEDLYSRK
jgi:magnesium transporter